MIKLFMNHDAISAFSRKGFEEDSEIEGFFITPSELEQLQREAFEAARSEVPAKTGSWHDKHFTDIQYPSFDDYLSSKSKEGK